ncbi:MAG: IPExxxVDY family protein [Cyclobacteriaceae bacterium]
MKKSKLVIDYEFDFELLGITTAARGYKLAWDINQHLGIRLVKQPDLMVGFKNSEEKNFSFYAFQTPLNRLKLFKNKPSDPDSGKYYLIPEFPHYDFIILAAMEDKHAKELIQLIKKIPAVLLVASIPLIGLKSKANFIF